MDPIIWIIVVVVGLLGFGTVDVQEARANPLGPPPWVTEHRPT